MAFEINYSALDRLLHRLAFSTPAAQFIAADLEETIFKNAFESVEPGPPVFITSIPRAGTTLLLEVLHRFPSMATHTYRDMPFVLAPLLWSRFSSLFHRRAELRHRAHGDGMHVGFDSPEAFEEIFWMAFWPGKYSSRSIALWDGDDQINRAREFFINHMKKIIALRRPDRTTGCRYLSKNNANIARLDLIHAMFPNAKVLVPIRHPVEHAASLLRQHQNFTQMHASEPFVRRYMADIGHFEFGELRRPIAFQSTPELTRRHDPMGMDYWIGYWIAAFEHLLSHRDKVVLVSYENTCAGGQGALETICASLNIPTEGMLKEAASVFKPPAPPRRDSLLPINPALLQRAEALHSEIMGHAIV